jgi:hypothetical protein
VGAVVVFGGVVVGAVVLGAVVAGAVVAEGSVFEQAMANNEAITTNIKQTNIALNNILFCIWETSIFKLRTYRFNSVIKLLDLFHLSPSFNSKIGFISFVSIYDTGLTVSGM